MLVKSGCWWQFLGIGERISLLVTSFECWCLSPTSVSNIRHRHRSFIKLYVSKIGHLADEGAIELTSLWKPFTNYHSFIPSIKIIQNLKRARNLFQILILVDWMVKPILVTIFWLQKIDWLRLPLVLVTVKVSAAISSQLTPTQTPTQIHS